MLADGGTFGTYREEASLGGAWKRFDYFSDFARFNTQNSIPNNQFHNGTYLGNFGWQLSSNTDIRTTIRRTVASYNSPNAIDLYGIPDSAATDGQDLAVGVTLQNRPNDRWHNLVRYGALRLRQQDFNFAATGIPAFGSDGSLLGYLGAPVTIRGANGYAVFGQAYFQSPDNYPVNSYHTLTNRDFVYTQTDYRFSSKLSALLGFRFEDERGYTVSEFAGRQSTSRDNYGGVVQIQGGLWNRMYYTLGGGIDANAVFGNAVTPRASLAYYLAKPKGEGTLSGTRIKFNFAKGIKEPSIYYQTNSLYGLLQTLPNGAQLIAQYGIHPFRAELSRTYDGGVEQELLAGKVRLSGTYFHNEFGDQAEFVSNQALPSLGFPTTIVSSSATQLGAAVNTLSYEAQGVELDAVYHMPGHVTARGGWTHINAVVQHSFSSDVLQPTFNPSFPTVQIGAYSPLVGARPFRVAPNSGYLALDWKVRHCFFSLKGTFVSRRDDSDFLVDQYFGPSLLLPNRNLDPAYQKLDFYASYELSKRVTLYSSLENLLNQRYYEAFGYPALPFTIRSGMKIRLGGESWKWD